MKKSLALMFVITVMLCNYVWAVDSLQSIAITIADYLTAARVVIATNQPLINDSARGDKGFTPAVYEKQVSQEFLKRSGIDIQSLMPLDDFNKSVIAIHDSAKEVIAEAQPQINESGKGFKGFISAVFGKRVGDRLF